MPRTSRSKSNSGVYHILLRSIDQQPIFKKDAECERFLDILAVYQKKTGYQLYAYCLMVDHAHLLIQEGEDDISTTMKRIGTSYVNWFNWQYARSGPLFADRFKSEAVEDGHYLLTVLRFIHQNPVKAGIARDVRDYKWSSFREYMGEKKLVDPQFVWRMFSCDQEQAIRELITYNQEDNRDQCLEVPAEKTKTISDGEIKQAVRMKYKIGLVTIQNQTPQTQAEILKYMKEMKGTSLRQIARLTGYSVNKIYRA